MSHTFQMYYREAGDPVMKLALDCIESTSIKAHVLEDWLHTAKCVESLQRYELYCVTDSGTVIGAAALAVEQDFNLGDCVSIVAARSLGRTEFMRFVIHCAKRLAKELGIRYVAYTKTISRLRYELRYLEV